MSSPNKLYEHFLQSWFDKETVRDSSRFRTEFEAIQQGAEAGWAVVFDVYRSILQYAAWCLFYQKHGVIAGIPWPLQSSEELIANKFRKLSPWQVPYWGSEVSNDMVKLAETGDIRSILDIDNGTKRLVKFIHESIGDFLVASSFVKELSRSHFNERVLAKYYPTEITEFVNEALLECDDMVFDSVICNLKSVLTRPISSAKNNDFDIRVKNWALYFLSRALFARSGTSQREEDLDVFRSMVDVAPHPWLRRTAYIGLIVLGDKAYETRYLRELAGNQLEQEYNIGDMLRYYGDIAFEATMPPDDIRLKRESMRSQGWRRCYAKLLRCFSSKNAKDRQLIGFRAITFLTMLHALDVSFLTKSPEQVELEARHLIDENMGLGTWDELLHSHEITGRHTPVGEIRPKTFG